MRTWPEASVKRRTGLVTVEKLDHGGVVVGADKARAVADIVQHGLEIEIEIQRPGRSMKI